LFCRSLPVMRGAGHEKYPVWTSVLDKPFLYNVKDKNSSRRDVVQKSWRISEGGFTSSGMSLDVWFPTFRRNVAPSLSAVSSPTTYPTTQHNVPEDLNFHQHCCENLKHHTANRY
jgi:hypothetical protein